MVMLTLEQSRKSQGGRVGTHRPPSPARPAVLGRAFTALRLAPLKTLGKEDSRAAAQSGEEGGLSVF